MYNVINEHIRARTTVAQASKKTTGKTAQVVRPCYESERGAPIDNDVKCGHRVYQGTENEGGQTYDGDMLVREM